MPAQVPGAKNAKGFPAGKQQVQGHLTLIDPATGKLQPVDDVSLQILRQWRSGNSVISMKDGSYGLGNVAPGVYSVIARGQNAFAAFSVNLHADSGVHDSTKSAIDLIIAAVPTSNMPQTKKLLKQTQPTGFDTRETGSPTALVNDKQDGDVRLLLSSYQKAELTDDSRLTGRIHRLDPVTGKDLPIINSTVYLLRNDHIVGREKLNRNGTFSMKFIRPAAYSLVASGEDGFLAISVDVVPHKNAARRNGAPTPVRFQEQVVQDDQVIDEFGVEAAFIPVELLQEEELVQEEGVPVIITQGGGAGFVGGAGGGSAGGGWHPFWSGRESGCCWRTTTMMTELKRVPGGLRFVPDGLAINLALISGRWLRPSPFLLRWIQQCAEVQGQRTAIWRTITDITATIFGCPRPRSLLNRQKHQSPLWKDVWTQCQIGGNIRTHVGPLRG